MKLRYVANLQEMHVITHTAQTKFVVLSAHSLHNGPVGWPSILCLACCHICFIRARLIDSTTFTTVICHMV